MLFGAHFIRGISGFGWGLVAVPLLALKLPLTFVVPVILLMDVKASLVLGGFSRTQVAWPELRRLLVPAVLGVVVGTSLLCPCLRNPCSLM